MAHSALYGRPPATQDDFWIAKGLLFQIGLVDADPSKGLPLKQFPPVDTEKHTGSIVAGVIVSIFLIVSITSTRLIARKMVRSSSLGWDDLLIVIAAAFAVVWFSLVGVMVARGGAGQHLFSITYEQYYWFARLGHIDAILLYVASSFAKFSIIFFNIRLTGLTSATWIWVHRIFFVLILAYALLALFFLNFACNPPATMTSLIALGKAAPNVKCNKNQLPVGLALQCLHSIFDWMLLSVPVIVVIRLKMKWQKKLQCIIPLSIGALSAIGASKRTYDAWHPPKDPTYHFIGQFPWNIVDLVCVICVTSLPAVNNIVVHYLPKTLSEYWSGGESSAPSAGAFNSKANKSGMEKSKPGSIDEEMKHITVKRDVDLESIRTEHEEILDPGYLELKDHHRIPVR